MVNYKYFDLFYKNNINKQGRIEYSGGVMTNKELFQNSEELKESLCSEKELRFGCCEASSFKFKVANIVKPMVGEMVTFSIVVGHHEDEPFLIGRYKVASDKETADRRCREIVAYDSMYDILNADVAEWYNALLPNEDSAVTLKQFREFFVRYFGLTEVLPEGGLVNDEMTVQRTIQPEQISGKDIITAICEINGCFGHIGRDGKFHYIYMPQAIEGLYPANDLYPDHAPEWMAQAKTGHLYPQDPKSTRIGKGNYIPPCAYESYRTKPITKIQIRQEENDIGKIWPETPPSDRDNCYIIQDNFLVYGKSSDELSIIAQNILGKITDIIYRPFDCTAVGNPCLEVGDPIRISTKYEIIESYILARTMKGIQALRDTYKSSGAEKYSENINGIHRSIIQLKGKTNVLTRTVEESKSEIKNVEKGLTTTITQTAGEIRGELENEVNGLSNTISMTAGEIRGELNDAKDGLENQISVTAKGFEAELKNAKEGIEASISATAKEIRTDMAATYETKNDASETKKSLQSSIEQTADGIRQNVAANYETKSNAEETKRELNSQIEQLPGSIMQTVSANYETKTNSGKNYEYLQSSIEQTERKIEQKVSIGDISSEISQEAGKIHIAAGRLSIDSTNFELTEEGEITSVKGTIGGFEITENSFGTNDDIISLHKSGDWAVRVGRITEFGSPGRQYEFCVGHEGNAYCNRLHVHENLHIWGDIIHEDSTSTVSLSDKKRKKDVSTLNVEKAAKFIYSLNPVSYRFKNGASGRTHHGLISQEVKKAMGEDDWGLYVEWKNEGDIVHGLRYEELIADLVATVQSLNNRVAYLEEKLSAINRRIAMNKAYYRINNGEGWENYPSSKTPLNKYNLDKGDVALDEIDNRVIVLDNTKATKVEVSTLIKEVSYDEQTGIITFTRKNGAVFTIDTPMEKIQTGIYYDPKTEMLNMPLIDGTTIGVDLSRLITEFEFVDSDTIGFSVNTNGEVSAIVLEGSIQEKHLRPDYLADIKVEVAKAEASASAAAQSEAKAAVSETAAKNSEDAARESETAAATSADSAGISANTATAKAEDAAASAESSASSAETATEKASAAKQSETNAITSAAIATQKANEAALSATTAGNKAAEASGHADLSRSYAVGTGGEVRENDDTDCAEYYYEQTKRISQSFSGVVPMGTTTFEGLSNPDNQISGYMFNVSDSFISDDRFADGGGIFYGAGSNVIYTADGKWDVLAAAMVSGVKGSAETEYRQGFVSLSPENVGAVNKRGDEMDGPLKATELWGGNKTRMWTDEEGGNFRIEAPDGTTWEIDAYDGNFRAFTYANGVKIGLGIDKFGKAHFPNGINLEGASLESSLKSNTHANGNRGIAIINSTAPGGGYVMLSRMKSSNGVFTQGIWGGKYILSYTTDAVVESGANSYTKMATLLDESGNTILPGTITASKFKGNLDGSATSAANADTIDGFHASQSAADRSTCVVRDSNGYVNLKYINSATSVDENPIISQVIVTNASDNYYRKASIQHLKASMALNNVNNTADSAKYVKGVLDYGNVNNQIQIGYAGTGLNANTATHVAAYTDSGHKIKDLSFANLKVILGLNNVDNTRDNQKSVKYSDSAGSTSKIAGYTWDVSVENKQDTWLLVVKDMKIQHRLVSSLPFLPSGKNVEISEGRISARGRSGGEQILATMEAAGSNFNLKAVKEQTSSGQYDSFINLMAHEVHVRNTLDTAWMPILASAFYTRDNSSKKLKEHIKPITKNRSRQIYKVKVVQYDYKKGVFPESYRYNRTGVIAEDTELVCPEAINYDNKGEPSGVQYDRFIPYLINEIQEHEKEIVKLKEENMRLEGMLDKIGKVLAVYGNDV